MKKPFPATVPFKVLLYKRKPSFFPYAGDGTNPPPPKKKMPGNPGESCRSSKEPYQIIIMWLCVCMSGLMKLQGRRIVGVVVQLCMSDSEKVYWSTYINWYKYDTSYDPVRFSLYPMRTLQSHLNRPELPPFYPSSQSFFSPSY
jgi:hypothetical protein